METSMMFGIAALVAHLIERVKRSRSFQWITPYTDNLTKIIAALVALLSSWGITTTFDHQAGVLAFSGIPTSVDAVVQLFVHAFGQYWMQKGYYLAAIKPSRMIQDVEAKL